MTTNDEPGDDVLRGRLARLESALPSAREVSTRRRSGLAVPSALALLLIGGAAGTAGAAALDAVRSSPGVFSPDGALACSNVRTMSPSSADEALRQLGYQVTWQIEDRDAGTSVTSTVPPASGYVQDGVLHGRDLLIVVETGNAATPAGPGC